MGTRADVLKAIPATNVRMTSTNVPTQISVSMERARYIQHILTVGHLFHDVTLFFRIPRGHTPVNVTRASREIPVT